MPILIFIFNSIRLWLFARRYDDWAVGAFAAILAVVAAFGTILLILVLLIFVYKREQKKIKVFQAFTAQNGWNLVPDATLDSFQDLSRYLLFRKGNARWINTLIQKPFDDGQIFVFDYVYHDARSSKNPVTRVIAFHSPHLQLPYFALYPESVLSFLGELVGRSDIDFVSHPNFSKRYKLSSEDEMQVRHIFHPQVLMSFENMPDTSIDGGGNYIFVYTPKQTIEVESLNTYLDNAKNTYNLFRR